MELRSIELTDYRNYEQVSLEFTNSLNIFLGENAQGKTNLLESIYVLGMARSHRTSNDRQLIRWQADTARLSGVVEKKTSQIPLEMEISSQGHRTKVNHIEQKKLSDYIGQLNIILFAPEDLSIIKGSPQVRRKFLDMEIGQVNPIYLHELVTYQRILKQRNQYLKQVAIQGKSDPLYLDILSEQLVTAGSNVLFYRYRFLQQLEKWAQSIHRDISHQKEQLTIQYHPSLSIDANYSKAEIATVFLDTLKQNRERELLKKATFVGPHRDDLIFLVNEKDVQVFGSQGQQRTAALSVKLAEIDLMKAETGEYPILLLDDVLSELDGERQALLLETIQNKTQTFITTTSMEQITSKLTKTPDIFYVQSGTIERKCE